MSEHRPVGWERMEADWWPAIAASMPRPWPEEAVLMDLRWWRGQEVATKRKLMPARRALQERWGWKEWDARMILRRESVWADPLKSSQNPPRILPESSQNPPSTTTYNADNIVESSQNPPRILPESSQNPPSRDLYTQNTEHRTQNTPSPKPSPEVQAESEYQTEMDRHFGKLAQPLANAGITTLDQLCQLTAHQTRMLRGIGEGNVALIQVRLSALGRAFAGAAPPAATSPPDVKKRAFTLEAPSTNGKSDEQRRTSASS